MAELKGLTHLKDFIVTVCATKDVEELIQDHTAHLGPLI